MSQGVRIARLGGPGRTFRLAPAGLVTVAHQRPRSLRLHRIPPSCGECSLGGAAGSYRRADRERWAADRQGSGGDREGADGGRLCERIEERARDVVSLYLAGCRLDQPATREHKELIENVVATGYDSRTLSRYCENARDAHPRDRRDGRIRVLLDADEGSH